MMLYRPVLYIRHKSAWLHCREFLFVHAWQGMHFMLHRSLPKVESCTSMSCTAYDKSHGAHSQTLHRRTSGTSMPSETEAAGIAGGPLPKLEGAREFQKWAI